MRYATRYRCISAYGPGRHTTGNGQPKRKSCTCGSSFYTFQGTWGVFVWRSDARYPSVDAVKQFSRETAAEQFTATDSRYVVRWISA